MDNLCCFVHTVLLLCKLLFFPNILSMATSWEQKFNELQNEYRSYKITTESKLLEYEESTKSKSNVNASSDYGVTFWKEVEEKVIREPESVKLMIKNKELSLSETNHAGRTVLCLAAEYGDYQLTQFCKCIHNSLGYPSHKQCVLCRYQLWSGFES